MKKIIILLIAGILAGCATTEYPIYKSEVYDNFTPVTKSKEESRQTKSSVTITDLGRVTEQIIPPAYVQACEGEKVLYKQVKKTDFLGNVTYVNEEIMESIDPFEGMHIRRISLNNNTGHTIKLVDVDAVLVDPNGNDHAMSSRERLERHINSKRPCSSTRAVISAFGDVAFLANPIRVRPGRDVEVFVPFPNKDNLAIPGEWLFEINDFPTRTADSGAVTKRDSFRFPIEMKQTATTVKLQKDSFFSPWKEIDRQTIDVE
jgi:uncharacterized protein YxeA